MEFKLIQAISFASFVWLAGVFLTPDALGADTVVYAIQGGTQALGMLDLNTGVYTQISPQAVQDYELGVYGGVLYGANNQCVCLFRLDPTTGASTLAPTLFNQNNNGFGAENGFGSTTDGLFIMGAAFGGINYLYSVNPTTGAPTLIGSTGVTTGGGTGFLSASNDSSKLYWEVQTNCTDALYGVNTSTGAATIIGSASACFPSKTGNPFSMVFTGGTLWANFWSAGFGTIDTSSGAQTLVSTNVFPAVFGLAPYPLEPTKTTFVGSMGHLAAEENWTTTFTLVNKGGAAAQATLNFFGDATDPSGNGPLALPLVFPQQGGNIFLSTIASQSVPANASLIVANAGPQTPPVLVGSAQLAAAGAIGGFAIFHQIVTGQEAVVPLETRSANSYLLAFDNTGGVVLGVAVDNISPQNAVIPVIIRNDAGGVISNPGATISLGGNGHSSFVLSDPVLGFPVTASIRGTIEFDTPAGGQISVLGLRFTPPNNALTTIPALANVGTGGGSIAHLASGGDGWQTTFALINVGTSAAQATLSFFADMTGAPMLLPLTFPQGNIADTTASSVTQSLVPGATLLVVSAGTPQLLTGSAQLSTTGNVSGFVIFRHNGQEAVVPLESRNGNAYILAFDNTNGTATGVALNAVSALPVNVPVVVRDDTGAQIATDMITLAANGHYAFTLGTDRYPGTATIRGTIEFDTPSGVQIGALGIRIPAGAAHTYYHAAGLGELVTSGSAIAAVGFVASLGHAHISPKPIRRKSRERVAGRHHGPCGRQDRKEPR